MPIILLWEGIPVFPLGGGYILVHAMHRPRKEAALGGLFFVRLNVSGHA
jgi:hypothetical protein